MNFKTQMVLPCKEKKKKKNTFSPPYKTVSFFGLFFNHSLEPQTWSGGFHLSSFASLLQTRSVLSCCLPVWLLCLVSSLQSSCRYNLVQLPVPQSQPPVPWMCWLCRTDENKKQRTCFVTGVSRYSSAQQQQICWVGTFFNGDFSKCDFTVSYSMPVLWSLSPETVPVILIIHFSKCYP